MSLDDLAKEGLLSSLPELTPTHLTSINKPMKHELPRRMKVGVVPGWPMLSPLYMRMGLRDLTAMPPVGTELQDDDGMAAVRAWIEALPN